MGHKFERCRMEPQEDGSVNIGITIVATIGTTDDPDPDYGQSAQWVNCSVAHAHAWDVCNMRTLFTAGSPSAKDKLVAWLQEQRRQKGLAIPKEIPLPTRKVTKEVDGQTQEVDEPIKDVSLT
jgi:hypothetical protein